MKRVVVYALGEEYKKNKEYIEKNYQIVGYSDRNKNISCDFVPPYRLKDMKNEVTVLVTSDTHGDDILDDLVKLEGLEYNEILLLSAEMDKNNFMTGIKQGHFVSHAERGEDYALFRILKDKGLLKVGERQEDLLCYVELGVMHPVINSNACFLDYLGVEGVCVEANPHLIPRIAVSRSNRAKIINKAVVDDSNIHELVFYVSDNPWVSSLDSAHVIKRSKIREEVTIQTICVDEIFRDINKEIVLLIDVEGFDEKIIRSLQNTIKRPVIIVAEIVNLSDELSDFMKSLGYSLVYSNSVNKIWQRD